MTQLEILKLALDGAERHVRSAAHVCDLTAMGDKCINNLKSAIQDFDEIKALIAIAEKSPGCSQQPRTKINVIVEPTITDRSDN